MSRKHWVKNHKGLYGLESYKYSKLEKVDRKTEDRILEADPIDVRFEGGGKFVRFCVPVEASEELPVGSYRVVTIQYEDYLRPIDLREDTIVPLKGVQNKIIEDINSFIDSKEVYDRLGITYKRGLLLHGQQGTGKTTVIRRAIRELNKDVIAIFTRNPLDDDMLDKLKEDDRLKIIVLEEITGYIKRMGTSELLEFLDGENALSNCIFIATTNYPDQIEANIIDRPSRFDSLYRVDLPDKEDRRLMLEHYLNREVTDTEVSATDGYSIAHIKEAALQMLIHGESLEQTKKRMDARTEATTKGDFSKQSGKQSAGFMGLAADPDYDEDYM